VPLLRAVTLGLCLAGCGGPAPPASSAPPSDGIWIRDVTVVSPERAEPLAHAYVLVERGRIARVEASPPARLDGAAIDGTGRFLVPGLIDGHVHLAEVPGVPFEMQAQMGDVVEAYFRQLPRSYLYFGFTTVVDLNVVDRPRLERIRSAPLRPEVFDCGNGLPVANGYPMSFMPPSLRFAAYPNFLDAARADHTPGAAVGRVAAGGGVCVKTYYEPGFGEQRGKLPVPSIDLLRDVASEAHKRRLPLLVHANSVTAHRAALAAGADAAAHGVWNWDDEASVRALVDDEVRANLGVMPTSRVISGLEGLFAPELLEDRALAKVLPAELVAFYRSDAGRWFAKDLARGFEGLPEPRIRETFRKIGDRGRLAARWFVERGGRLYFGSDTPSAPTYANPPGYNGFLEMKELEAAGIPSRAIFVAATSSNAKLFGLADHGTIEPGKKANLLLLRASPLAGVAAFDTIETVFLDGRPIARADLSVR
jgi:imidazolonepropionase-like amidohydrolase